MLIMVVKMKDDDEGCGEGSDEVVMKVWWRCDEGVAKVWWRSDEGERKVWWRCNEGLMKVVVKAVVKVIDLMTDRQTNWLTDIGGCRVAFATEKF